MKNERCGRPGIRRYLIPALLVVAVLFLTGTARASKVVEFDITVGKSAIHNITGISTAPHRRYKDIVISDDKIAEVVTTKDQLAKGFIRIIGKKVGSTDMIIWYDDGTKDTFDVNVNVDTSLLEERIAEAAPGDPVVVKAMKNTIIVTGSVRNAERYFRVDNLLQAMGRNVTANKTVTYLTGGQTLVTDSSNAGTDSDTGIKYANLLEISGQPQVLLHITVASIDRTALRDLGINFSEIAKGVAIFSTVGSALPISKITDLVAGGSLSPSSEQIFQNNPNLGVIDTKNGTAYMIKALSSKGLAKVLAEPDLIVKSGESGEFKAGGSIPIPVVQSAAVGVSNAITVVYQDFGVIINFKPTVKESGVIQLKLDPAEVSSLDFANAVTLSGFSIPALKKDTVKTSVDLREGESFVVAGLLKDDWAKNLDKFPILGDIPILGAFFRQQHMEKTERELVFLVTPSIVAPAAPGTKTEIPGANEPTPAQNQDMKWMPLMPTNRSMDPENVGK